MEIYNSDKLILEFMEKTNTWKLFYDEIGKLDFLQTMNWGYSLNHEFCKISNYNIPNGNSESDINSFNLYYYLVNTAINKSIIKINTNADIGCGKGGGINFIKECFGFKSSYGYDFSDDGLKQARLHYKNINFINLDVRKLKKCKKVDLVTNVESFHCYGTKSNFFENCYNMLNENGILAMTDFIDIQKLNIIGEEASNFFDLLYVEDISPNVIKSLNQKIRTNDTAIGLNKIKLRYPFLPELILNKIAHNFSGEQNKHNMINNKTVYFLAIFIRKTIPINVVNEHTKKLNQYIEDNLKKTVGKPELFIPYMKHVCKLSVDVICNILKDECERHVAEIICKPSKLIAFEPLASLNHTSPYVFRKYKKTCKINFSEKCIDYKYQTCTPPSDNLGIIKTNIYNASDFKRRILPHEYIAHEKVPYSESYETIRINRMDCILKNKMESYYYGLNKGSKLHSDNTISYILQLTGKKLWTIYNPAFIPLLKPHLLSELAVIYLKNATDISNRNIPRYKITLEADDLLVVPYGLPHEVMCFENIVSEHINYREIYNPELYLNNHKSLYDYENFMSKLMRNNAPSVLFHVLKSIHDNKTLHKLAVPIEKTIDDFYATYDKKTKLYFENTSVDEIIDS